MAQQKGAILYDLNALFARAKIQGVTVGSRTLTADFQGGLYSLDGYYLCLPLVPARSPEPNADRASVETALSRLSTVIPAMGRVAVSRYWAGLVDMTPDGLPVIDTAGPHGLTLIAGLSGHGLALGPVLGEIACDLSLDGHTQRPIDSFRLDRFSEKVASPQLLI